MSMPTNGKRAVFFRFEGKRGTGVESIDVAIESKVLKAFPETVLAKLVEDTWNVDKTAGDAKGNPIVSRPMDGPCEDQWSPSLANLIVETYNFRYANEDGEFGLVASEIYNPKKSTARRPALPVEVKLEDALAVLDFYGFPINDGERIHVKLQLKELALVEDAAKYVVAELDQNPCRENLFLFASQGHDMEYINGNNDFKEQAGATGKFVRIGGDSPGCTEHFVWAKDPFLRRFFLQKLKQKLPAFEVTYLSTNFVDQDRLRVMGVEYNLFKSTAFSLVDAKNNCTENDYIPPDVESMLVLCVRIPICKGNPRKRKLES